MSFIGELVYFDYKSSEWAVFKCQLNQFFIVNDVEDAKKSAVLLTHLTEESRSLLRDLAYPDRLEECSFTQLVALLDDHFEPRKRSFADRAKFYGAAKRPDESLADWAARLRGLATSCGFGTASKQILTDRFVLGLGAGPVRDELFEEDAANLTLAEALNVAQRAESASQANTMRTTMDEPIHRATHKSKSSGGGESRKEGAGRSPGRASASSDRSSRVPKCVACGRNHLGKCSSEEYRCNKCGLIVSTVNINETESESDVRCCEECQNLISTFDMAEFKRCYCTQDESVSVPYFWKTFDPDHYSIWFAEYKYPHELTKVFMSCNLITGMFQRLDKMRKQMFASVCLFGGDDDSTISGVWVWRGQQLVFALSPDWQDSGYESYKWTKLDPTNVRTKKLVKDYFSWSGTDAQGRPFNQGKIFK